MPTGAVNAPPTPPIEKVASHNMNAQMLPGQSEKESVALGSVFASGGMALMKLVVGLMTGSIGILSEAAMTSIPMAMRRSKASRR
jgi:hypothetical protein